jgi:hypothetical protein
MITSARTGQSSPAPFDTTLLQQIISIEVEECVRSLHAEGMIVEMDRQHQWNESLYEILTHIIEEEAPTHSLMPQEFEEELHQMLKNLIDVDFGDEMEARYCAIVARSSESLFGRLRQFWHRLMWRKHA